MSLHICPGGDKGAMNTLAGLARGTLSERGLSLVELLVVMLVIGVLAVIAIPSLLNQKSKGSDAEAKSTAVTAEKTIESCATETGTYENCSESELLSIEPALKDAADRSTTTCGPRFASRTGSSRSTAIRSTSTVGRGRRSGLPAFCSAGRPF